MSGYSDVIKQLSTTTALNASEIWTSEKIIAGQYSSMTISHATDQDSTLTVYFSNDGANFDVIITRPLLAGASYDNILILGKWIKIAAQNVSITNQTYFRLYVYGSTQNTALTAQITGQGNNNPVFDIANLPRSAFGELKCEIDKNDYNFIFTYGTSGHISTNDWKYPNTDLKAYSGDTSGYLYFNDSSVTLSNLALQPTKPAILYSSPATYVAGTGINARFTSRFKNASSRPVGSGCQYQLIGIGYHLNGVIRDGYFFGNVNTASSDFQMGIHHFNRGVLTSYLQNAWNVDKCDGNNLMPVINWKDYINVFSIQMQYLGAGDIIFSIENPNTGLFQTVHIIKYANANNKTSLSNPALGMLMYARNDDSFLLDDNIYSYSFKISNEGEKTSYYDMNSVSVAKNISGSQNIMHLYNNTTFFSSTNRVPLYLKYLSVSSDGTKPVNIKLIKDPTVVGSIYTTPYINLSPMIYDISGIYTSGTGVQALGLELGKSDRILVDLGLFNSNMVIHPGENMIVMASSTASNDINLSLSWQS